MNDLSKISQITENIFVSGVLPIEENYDLISKSNIKYILSCVDRIFVSEIHDKILMKNPDIMILYLPYNDDIQQNLWEKNKDRINIVKYTNSMEKYNKIAQQLITYDNKPMIEIGYSLINDIVMTNKNILVHCMAGISRSVSVVTYYFMKKYYIDYNTAFIFIKNKRNVANPNESFREQLKQYQIKRDKFTEADADKIISKIKYSNSIE